MLADLLLSRQLAFQLALRDIRAQYRQSLLGFLWMIALPLANALIWILLKNSGVVALADVAIPYALFALSGTLLWSVFTDATLSPIAQLMGSKHVLVKINFPAEAIFLSGIYQTVLHAGIKTLILFTAWCSFGLSLHWSWLLFPLAVLALILVGTTLGMLLTPVGMLYSDIQKVLPLVLQLLMFATPVVFAVPAGSWAAKLFAWNPLTPLFLTGRHWLSGQEAEELYSFVVVCSLALIFLLVVWVAFRLAKPIIVERIGT
ncbi:MAG: ABC transporter permease [Saprospiraceae bacterium]|nr:ABC transporter permease [Saprospiraceae bacterium]